MQGGDNDVRRQGARGDDGVGDAVRVDVGIIGIIVRVEQVRAVFRAARQAHAVHALCKGYDGDPDAVRLHKNGAILRAVLSALIGADGREPGAAQDGLRALQPAQAVLDRIGICGLHERKACAAQGCGQRIRRTAVVIRLAGEGRLQIADRDVGRADNGSRAAQNVRKIIAAALSGCLQQFVGDADVADGAERRHCRFAARRFGLCGRVAAAAAEQRERKAERQKRRCAPAKKTGQDEILQSK